MRTQQPKVEQRHGRDGDRVGDQRPDGEEAAEEKLAWEGEAESVEDRVAEELEELDCGRGEDGGERQREGAGVQQRGGVQPVNLYRVRRLSRRTSRATAAGAAGRIATGGRRGW